MSTTTPLSTHTAARRKESRALVDDGAAPLRRLATPAVQVYPGDGAVFLWLDHGKLRFRIASEVRPAKADAEALAEALGQPGIDARALVVADRATVAALSGMANKAADRGVKGVLRAYAYLARQPWSAISVCLTDALATQFWIPAGYGEKSLADWSAAFGVSRADPDAAMGILVPEVTGEAAGSSTLPVQTEWGARIPHRPMLRALASKFASDQILAYVDASKAASLWTAIQSVDPIFAPTAVLAGDASRIVNLRMERGQIIGEFASPVRIKPKSWMTVLDERNARTGSVKLEGFGFDESTGRVLGIIKHSVDAAGLGFSRTMEASVRHGIEIVTAGSHVSVVAIERPFTGSQFRRAAAGTWAKAASGDGAAPAQRAVPGWLLAAVSDG